VGSGRVDCTVDLTGAAAGAWDVVVQNPDAASGRLSAGFAVTGTLSSPTISSLSPTTGAIRTKVTISGSGFGSSRGSCYLTVGAVRPADPDYVSWSDTRVEFYVPVGAWGNSAVNVYAAGGKTNAKSFAVKPTMSSFSPTSISRGRLLTVSGNAFGRYSKTLCAVYFNTGKVAAYTWANNKVVVTVPGAAGNYKVTLRTSGGTSNYKYIRVY
jgi:hypothetical protein